MNIQKFFDRQKVAIRSRGKNRLLPRSFKWVGLIVALIPIGIAVFLKMQGMEFGVGKIVFPSVMIFGLTMIVMSRDKMEDEMKTQLRGQAFTYSFLFGVLYGAGLPLLSLLTGSITSPEEIHVSMILVTMLVTYLSTFNLLKWAS